MKLIVLDSGLLSLAGHHYHLDLALTEQGRAHGFDVTICGNKGMGPDIVQNLNALPIFDLTAYSKISDFPDLDYIEDYGIRNRVTYENLSAALTIPFCPDDLIMVHTMVGQEMIGLHRWYTELPEPRPRLLMLMRFQPWFRLDPALHQLSVALHSHSLALWRRFPLEQVAIATDNPGLANFASRLAQRPVTELPIPIIHKGASRSARSEPAEGQRLNFVYLGEARFEKGFHHLMEAIERGRGLIPGIRFTIQTGLYRLLSDYIDQWQARLPDVDFVTRELAQDDYFALLHSADAVLVPYDPVEYSLRTSHVLLEAIGAGKPVLTTAGSWMDLEMNRLEAPGVCAEAFTPDAIIAAMRWLAENWQDYAGLTENSVIRCRARHNPSAFFHEILSLFPNKNDAR